MRSLIMMIMKMERWQSLCKLRRIISKSTCFRKNCNTPEYRYAMPTLAKIRRYLVWEEGKEGHAEDLTTHESIIRIYLPCLRREQELYVIIKMTITMTKMTTITWRGWRTKYSFYKRYEKLFLIDRNKCTPIHVKGRQIQQVFKAELFSGRR